MASSATAKRVDELVAKLWDRKGTDLLLTVGAPPLVRVDGELHPLHLEDVLTAKDTQALADAFLGASESADPLGDRNEVDFSFTWRDLARVRGNAFHQRGTVSVALRLILQDIPGFDDIGLPESVRRLATLSQGLVLMTGPTGSGKSTTLASLIDWINTNRAVHVITIEDPIEYVHNHKRSAVNQREVGPDTESFASALRSALREDPDVLLVGEMRDLESIQFALTLAETGHLVFATLHTNDSAQAIDRLVDVFPAERQAQIRVQLANALTAVVYQRLVPRIDGGMVAAFEVLLASSAVRNLVHEGKTNQLRNVVSTHFADGMQTLERHLSQLVREGVVAHDTAVGFAGYPNDVEKPVPVAPAAPPAEVASGRGLRRRSG
jgi:twitching motility protein PilT